MDILSYAYIIFSAIFVLFLPGFFLSLVFFDFDKIDLIERVALSFALSISVIPLLTFYLNLVGIKISFQLVFVEVIVVSLVSILIYLARYRKRRR